MKMTRYILLGAAASLAALSTTALAAVSTINYAAIVRANDKAVADYKACATDACRAKVVKSVNYRIANSASKDPALTPAVQRATARQLLEIFNTSLSCPAGQATTCAKQNTKTFGSLTYRITNQKPVSPV